MNPMYNDIVGYKKNETWKQVSIHDDLNIIGFFDKYRWLSNFEICKISILKYDFNSVENAYQAMKFHNNIELFESFVNISPSKSKRRSNELKEYIVENWDNIKLDIMKKLLIQKFSDKNIELKNKLIQTGNKHLEEANWWNDKFFGTYKGEGENNLGKMIMDIRKTIILEK